MVKVLRARYSSTSDIADHVFAIDQGNIREHNAFFSRVAADMRSFPTIESFVFELRKYVQFLDCKLVKEIIRAHANPELLKKIEEYESAIEEFCRNTYIAHFIRSWDGHWWELPPNFVELKAKLTNLDPYKCTLHDLQKPGRELWKMLSGLSFRPRAYDVCAMIFHKVNFGSVNVIWRVPCILVPQLMKKLEQDELKKFFCENGFVKVSVDGRVAYSYEGKTCIHTRVCDKEERIPKPPPSPPPPTKAIAILVF